MDSTIKIYQGIPEFWGHWGFEPWQWEGLEGVWRKVEFKKGSLMGPVALYYSYDFIVWKHEGLVTKDFLLEQRKWEPDLMTQRFLLLGTEKDSKPWIKSFFLGFRGFVEVLRYSPGEKGHRKFRDLTDLVGAVDGYRVRRDELFRQAESAPS